MVLALIQVMKENPSRGASVLSIGIHGILFAIMPFISFPEFADDELDIQRQVSVIDLDAEQLSRVPDFSSSALQIPSIPTGDDFDSVDDLPSLELDDDYIPPLAPPPPIPFSSIWPLLPSRTPAPIPTLPVPPTPPNDGAEPITESPEPIELEAPITGPEELTDPEEPPEPQETQEERTRRLIAERLSEQAELRRLFTQAVEPKEIFGQWNDAVSNAGISPPTDTSFDDYVFSETFPFPQQACPFIQQGMIAGASVYTSVGFVVGTDNQILEQPEPLLVSTSGIPFFDEQSLEAIADPERDWGNTTGTPQSRLLNITFEYTEESCPDGMSPP